MQLKARQFGQNLIIVSGKDTETIVFPKGYVFDKVFSLIYKNNEGSSTAGRLLEKEFSKYRKSVIKNGEVLKNRIDRKKLSKEIKKIRSIDVDKLPITLTKEWMEVLDSKKDTTNIENFLIWLSMNDNKKTRDSFLKEFNSKYPYITKNGFLVSIRSVWKEKEADRLYDFIQSEYVKIKGWRKGPKNYAVVHGDGQYFTVLDDRQSEGEYLGNLQDLYESYNAEDKTTYVSNYSKQYLGRSDNWTIGSVAEIHDKATHAKICGMNQLHILSNPLDAVSGVNGNYGDTFLIVLTNPKDIINAEYGWKFTTSRFYIAAEISKDEISEYFTEHWGDFDYDYLNIDAEKIKEAAIKEVSASNKIVKKEKISSLTEQKKGLVLLNNKVDHIDADVYQKIIQTRVSLIK